MQRTVVLDVRAAADNDGGAVATHHSIVPDAGAFVDDDVTNHERPSQIVT